MWGLKHKSYNCERCGKDFVSRAALRYHFQAKHLWKVYAETCSKDLVPESSSHHAKNHHEMTQMGNLRSCWTRRKTKFGAMEVSTSCRMCSRQFGTVHARENHEKQEHHFTTSKRGNISILNMMKSSHYQLFFPAYKTPTGVKYFMEAELQPIRGPARLACASEVEGMIASIKEVFPLPITYITKGGSYIKGTDIQEWSDVDIVIFSNAFKDLEDCQKKVTEILEELGRRLMKSSWTNRLIFQKRTSFSLRVYFKCYKDHHGHLLDVMLCYDILWFAVSSGLKESFYHQLYLCSDNDKIQLYTMALLKYQVEFVKASTQRLKDLIRLIKHWFKTSFAKSTKENRFRRLPSSYAVELITIYVWELAGKPIFFSFVQGMRAVLKLLVQYQDICIVWHKHYKPNFAIFQKVFLKQTRPFILDPVNPTFNVCENSNAWDEVAYVARKSLLKPLFNGMQAKEPWLFTNNW
ncbi:hypothetical protein JD844_008828 [Phrynosoma platyrhinos]|uniref:C2H2-type domain-containing protein n=1 Tax=Phrynosoma platyrhinos TaxID=52577 RepID=A0ABQ7TEM4_PHRPL|nr:hypothetical protein JD844_008828 [Phrynosoma platyrhinos]